MGAVLHPHQTSAALSRQRESVGGVNDLSSQPQQLAQSSAHAQHAGQAAEEETRMGSERAHVSPHRPQAAFVGGGGGGLGGGVAHPRVEQALVDQGEKLVVEPVHSIV